MKVYVLLIALSLSTPLIIFIVALIFYRFPPKNINSFCGYRTTRSMKNIETWNEANKYSAILMIKFSLLALLITTVGLILVGKSYDDIAIVTIISAILTVAFLIIVIILTEKHLKSMFGV